MELAILTLFCSDLDPMTFIQEHDQYPLEIIIIVIIIERRDFGGIMSNDCKDTLQTQNKTVQLRRRWNTRWVKIVSMWRLSKVIILRTYRHTYINYRNYIPSHFAGGQKKHHICMPYNTLYKHKGSSWSQSPGSQSAVIFCQAGRNLLSRVQYQIMLRGDWDR